MPCLKRAPLRKIADAKKRRPSSPSPPRPPSPHVGGLWIRGAGRKRGTCSAPLNPPPSLSIRAPRRCRTFRTRFCPQPPSALRGRRCRWQFVRNSACPWIICPQRGLGLRRLKNSNRAGEWLAPFLLHRYPCGGSEERSLLPKVAGLPHLEFSLPLHHVCARESNSAGGSLENS